MQTEVVFGVGSAGGQVLLKGLTPITDYSIQVAAVNNQSDVGVFNEPIYLQTCEKRQFFHMICISLHSMYTIIMCNISLLSS